MKPEVLIVGGGMITHDQILPSLYHLQRLGRIGEISVCSQRRETVAGLAAAEDLAAAFPGQSFRAHSHPDVYSELIAQLPSGAVPDAIVHASSSGGTQAGLTAGCALHGLPTRVVGISADDPVASIEAEVRRIVAGLGAMLGTDGDALARGVHVAVDDSFVGEGYGVATTASREAQSLAARTEALFVDHTYTAKALAALITFVRDGRYRKDQTIVFWHTGGQVGLFT